MKENIETLNNNIGSISNKNGNQVPDSPSTGNSRIEVLEYFLFAKGEKKQGPFSIEQFKTAIAELDGNVHIKIRSSNTSTWISLDKAEVEFPELVSSGAVDEINEWKRRYRATGMNKFLQKKNQKKTSSKKQTFSDLVKFWFDPVELMITFGGGIAIGLLFASLFIFDLTTEPMEGGLGSLQVIVREVVIFVRGLFGASPEGSIRAFWIAWISGAIAFWAFFLFLAICDAISWLIGRKKGR